MTDFENAFGYDTRIPENIREIFMWLCQDAAALQNKWDFYQELYNKEENATLLSELALWAFNIIEESLRNDMTMAICRLCDPSVSKPSKENLSLATLVEKSQDISGLDQLLANVKEQCKPISKWRNKQVGHNDLRTRIHPRENPLPGITKYQIDEIIRQVSDILGIVYFRYTCFELNFHTISQGNAEDLIFWLKSGRDHHSSA